MRSSRKKWPGAWIGIVLASSFLLVGAMKMSAYAEPAESTETAEITESSTGAGLSDMDFGMGDGQIELDPYDQVSDLGLVTVKRYRADRFLLQFMPVSIHRGNGSVIDHSRY